MTKNSTRPLINGGWLTYIRIVQAGDVLTSEEATGA